MPAAPPVTPSGWPATAPSCVPGPGGATPRRQRSSGGQKLGLAPPSRAQPGSPLRCGGSRSGVRAPPPLPRRAPGDLLIKIAAAPRPRVRPLPPRPGGGRSARPSRSSARPGRQPSGGPPTRRGIKNPETPDPPATSESRSPRPLPTASLLRRRRRQQLLLETARDRPPRLTRDRARAPGTLAQRARLSQAVPGAARPRPGERLDWIAQSGAGTEERARSLVRSGPRALGRAHSRASNSEALSRTAEFPGRLRPPRR